MNYRKIENQKFSMKKIVLAVMGMFALSAGAYAQENAEARNDSVKVRYIYTMQASDNCMPGIDRNHVIFVNDIPVLFQIIAQKPDERSHDLKITALKSGRHPKNLFRSRIGKNIFQPNIWLIARKRTKNLCLKITLGHAQLGRRTGAYKQNRFREG